MSVRIGVISDTHIPSAAKEIPPQILEAFKKVDMIIHAGDFIDCAVLEQLKNVCKNVTAVYGNMDPNNLKDTLPRKEIIKIDNFKIGVMHGWGAPNKLTEIMQEEFKNDNVNIVIFGHSHSPLNEKKEGILYFNPGSPTDKVFAVFNSYGIIEINDEIKAKIVRI